MTVLGDVIKQNGLSCEGSAPIITIDLSNNIVCGVTPWGKGTYDGDGLADFCTAMNAMSKVSRLRKLDFSRNYLHVRGFQIITNLIVNGPSSLIEISLRLCEGVAEAIEKLCEGLKSAKYLQILDLSENPIGPRGGQLIGDALASNSRLRQLNVNHCDLFQDGCNAIFQALQHSNNTLEVLSLNGNNFGDTGCEALASMLRNNNKLRVLDIQENSICYDGICVLSRALARNRTLTFLGLQWNDISNDGAAKLGDTISSNNVLTAIHILGNHIDIDGIKSIVHGSLQSDNKPIELDLGFAYKPIGRKSKGERKVIKEFNPDAVTSSPTAGITNAIKEEDEDINKSIL
jgi:Ran GTPase-activating protein (RanGAP) involved in mRNA processing and transport